ncbi:MAG: ATP-grasp domain-containing protein [Pyrinomonadaceae bacterium]
MDTKKIAIYYEHPEWFRPLFAELDRCGTRYEKIDATRHFFDPAEAYSEKYTVFFNRMSASAYLRGHANSILYTRGLLASLEKQGIRAINGYDAFEIEISKVLQLSLFASLGISFPKTRIVNSVDVITEAASGLEFPLIVKPNIGGRGAGIVKFDTSDALADSVKQGVIDLGLDSTALVQEFIPKKGGHINRVETLGGKFLYAIRIYPQGENFNLCPAEICQIEDQYVTGVSAVGEMCLTDAPSTGLRIEAFQPTASIIETVERIVKDANIDVGGVEYLVDERTGEPLFYDINALSNFVADAVNLIGFDPHERLVDFIEQEIKKCATDTGCLSSVVG